MPLVVTALALAGGALAAHAVGAVALSVWLAGLACGVSGALVHVVAIRVLSSQR